jgi:hypothetical protein
MQKKLTLTIDQEVYEALYRRIGARRISGFVEDLVRPHVMTEDEDSLAAEYEEWSTDEEAVREALEWSNGLIGDSANEAW